MSKTTLSVGFFAAIAFALVVYFVVWHTVVGYEIRAAGLNPTAAKYGGINSRRTMLLSFLLGGMAAGLAGACYVMGTPPTYAVFAGLPELSNLGFDGMAAFPGLPKIPFLLLGGLVGGSAWRMRRKTVTDEKLSMAQPARDDRD